MSQQAATSSPTSSDEERRLVTIGRRAINQLYILIRSGQIHHIDNPTVQQPAENLLALLAEGWQIADPLELRYQSDRLLFQDLPMRVDIEGFLSFTWVMNEFKRRLIGAICFHSGLNIPQLKKFVGLFLQYAQAEQFDDLERAVSEVGNISVTRLRERREERNQEALRGAREQAKRTYTRTLLAVSEVMEGLKLKQAISLRKAKRVVQTLIDLMLREESTLLGLTTLRNHDEYTYHHSVNVCILSMAVGQRIGYDRCRLTDLGMASLLHDIGKSDIPLEVLNKPAEFTDEEWRIIRRHPILGVKNILKFKGVNNSTLHVVIGAFEHHLNYDLSGYPRLARPRTLTVFGRIISIVDCFDALTSSRVYNRIPFPPDKALKFMLSRIGKAFDPILLKLFINCIGIYPIGTLVILDTGEVGVVYETNPNPERTHRPRVRLILDSAGKEIPDGPVVDLVEMEGGRFRRTITKTLDANQHKIKVSQYFL